MQLSPEELFAIDHGDAVPVIVDNRDCVLVARDVYERAQRNLDYDGSEPTVEELDAIAAEVVDSLWQISFTSSSMGLAVSRKYVGMPRCMP